MNKLKKIATLLLTTFMLSIAMVGCGEKIESPELVTESYYDLIVYGDTSKLESMGLGSDDVDTLKEEIQTQLKTQTKNNFTASGLKITDEQLENVVNAQKEAMKKISCTVEPVSSDKQTAVVTLKTNYLNITEADEKAANEAVKEAQSMGITSQKELLEKATELYINKLIDACKNIEPSSETVEKNMTLKLQSFDVNGKAKKMWAPENPVTFGNDIGTMVTH